MKRYIFRVRIVFDDKNSVERCVTYRTENRAEAWKNAFKDTSGAGREVTITYLGKDHGEYLVVGEWKEIYLDGEVGE